MAIEWSKKYSVGLDEIDAQHKELIRLINALEVINDNFNLYKSVKEPLLKIMSDLKNYTVLHFATEEVLMSMFDYELGESHKHAHDNFVKLVGDQFVLYLKVFHEIDSTTDEEKLKILHRELHSAVHKLIEFLQKWLVNHIMKSDMEYVSFFNEIKKKAKNSGGWLSFLKG